MKTFTMLFTGAAPQSELSPEELQHLTEQWGAWIGEMRRTGQFTSGILLDSEGRLVSDPTATAPIDAVVDPDSAVGACLLITADDMQAAVEIAKVCPILTVGGRVEVREVRDRTM